MEKNGEKMGKKPEKWTRWGQLFIKKKNNTIMYLYIPVKLTIVDGVGVQRK
jgi:hypothetical protein